MNNLAVLIAAVAGLIGALTSFVGMIVVVRRTSPRERQDAAAGAAEKVLMPPNPLIDLNTTLINLDADRGTDDDRGNAHSDTRSS